MTTVIRTDAARPSHVGGMALPWSRWAAAIMAAAPTVLWGAASIALFAGIWEMLWALGWADARLLPPPHIFIGNIADQAKFFNTVNRWQIGAGQGGGTSRCWRCSIPFWQRPAGCSPAW
jgi:hypothetical protein